MEQLDYLTPLFWDTDITKLDQHQHKQFIIERILKYGRPETIKWLWQITAMLTSLRWSNFQKI